MKDYTLQKVTLSLNLSTQGRMLVVAYAGSLVLGWTLGCIAMYGSFALYVTRVMRVQLVNDQYAALHFWILQNAGATQIRRDGVKSNTVLSLLNRTGRAH